MTRLLCTDLDRTLLPNGQQPESASARPILWHLLRTHEVLLTYVSGRDLQRVQSAIEQYELANPDVIVADVGTSIYLRGAGGWQQHEAWQSCLDSEWNGMDSDGIGNLLSAFTELQVQEADRQSRFKRSYYLSRKTDTQSLLANVEKHLLSHHVKAALVFSDDPEKNIGLLDVLPVQATKKDAIMYVGQLLGIEPAATLFSGDSGNDVSALASELPSVTVRNADSPTQLAVREQASQNGTLASTYLAQGGLSIVPGETLNGNYAAGIVEGLLHFNPNWAVDVCGIDWASAKTDNARPDPARPRP